MVFAFNFDLLSVGVVVAANLLIGFAVFFSDRKSATAALFFALTFVVSAWSILNYLTYQVSDLQDVLWIERFVLFFAVPMSILFVLFIYTFPGREWMLARWKTYTAIVLSGVTMIVTLTPFVFSRVLVVPGVPTPQPVVGPGMGLFFVVAVLSIPLGIYLLVRKFYRTVNEEHGQVKLLLIGLVIMFTCIIVFNFIFPAVLNNTSFIPLSAIFVFPFVAFTAYAIYRHHLFNLKVATTAFLGFMVTIFSFVNIIYSMSLSEVAINVTAFVIVLIGSIKIVQDTLTLKKLTEELSETNERQEGLIHFIGHEVKGFLTKDTNALAALAEDDFGALPDALKPFVEHALAESRQGADSVATILKASNLKKGTVTYTRKPFDLKTLTEDIVEKAKSAAEQKGLILSYSTYDPGVSYTFTGDKGEIGDHVLRNLIDNAINYTPSGSIDVSLKKENGKIVFAVKDTGIGITEEDKKRLFTEGGHGKDSQKVNVHSTGYGLYIAKSIVEAHGGTIRAESAGAGKGSTFVAEFPQ